MENIAKEKQIEEMAKEICKICSSDGECINVKKSIICKDTYKEAEHLYKAGYRKQSEGEWILEHKTYGKMRCSVCGKECPTERKPDPYEDYQKTDYYITSPFCPNCGAKMKGGDE